MGSGSGTRVTLSTRANLTSSMASGNGLGTRLSGGVFIARPQNIDRSYQLKKGPLSSAL